MRIHNDPPSHVAAHSLSAQAFTVGNDIALGPLTESGTLPVLAHELAHVIQQRGDDATANSPPIAIGEQRDPVEGAADTAAVAALQPDSTPVDVVPVPTRGVVRRSPDPPPSPKAPVTPPAPAPPKNSTEAETQTLASYPKDADLEKAFARFKGIPEISGITDPVKRRAFLARMSLYLGPHPAAENHFAKIRKAKYGRDQWAFESVVDRLNAVHDELKAKRHSMAESGANFALRGLADGPVLPRGL